LAVKTTTLSTVVLDDEPVSADTIAKVLNQAHLSTQIVATKEILFSLVESQTIDVVVVSRVLPQSNGLEVMQRVRELCAHTAVILISNRSEPFSMDSNRPEVVLERPFASLQAIEEAVREAIEVKARHSKSSLTARVSEAVSEAISVFVPRRNK
jgi:DNA-binding NtrC family response regulator